ncbi:MAG: PAS domain-containing protein, partial [Bacteroidales bacterium]
MNIEDKTKQELINELKELQQKYDSLKFSIKTDFSKSEHTEEALHKCRKLLKSMEETAKIGGWEFDVESNKQIWTDEVFHILEIDTTHGAPDVPEGIGFIAPEYQPMALLGIQRAIEFGEPYNQEWQVITAKGNKCWINAIATPYQENGKTISISGSFQDITKRKQVEDELKESEERFKNMFERHSSIMLLIEPETGKIIGANEASVMFYGYSKTELLAMRIDEVNMLSVEQIKIEREKAIHEERNYFVFPHRLANGELRTVEVHSSPIVLKNQRILFSIIHDITERKLAEITLHESEENLATTLHSIGDGVISTDVNGLIVNMNPVAEKLCGWNLTDALGKPLSEIFKIINSETRQIVADPIVKVLEKGEIVGLANHTVLVSKNGAEYQISDSAAPIKNKEGAITGVVFVFSDVTESYLAQKHIKESQERYGSLLGNLEAGIVVHAPDTAIIMNNHRASELLGLTDDQMRGKAAIDPAWKFIHEDNSLLTLDEYPVNRIATSKQDIKKQILGIVQPNKSDVVWVTVNGFPVLDANGAITEIVISFIDITDHIKSVEKIKLSEAKFSKSFFNSPDSIVINRLDNGKIVSVNNGFRKIMGYEEAEVIGKTTTELNFYKNPEERNAIINALKTTGQAIDIECWFNTKHGEEILGLLSAAIIDIDGVNHIMSTSRDVTERKQIELLLQEKTEEIEVQNEELNQTNQELIAAKEKAEESEEKYRLLFENANEAIYIVQNEKLVFTNPTCEQITGISKENLIGFSILELVDESEKENLSKHHYELINGINQNQNSFFAIFNQKGEKRHLSVNSVLIKWNGLPATLNFGTDISERKQAEEALKASEEKFSNAFYTSPYAITITSPKDGTFIDINDAFTSLTGYTREEAFADSSVGLKLWADINDRNRVISDLKEGIKVAGKELLFRKKNGDIITAMFSAQIIHLNNIPYILSSINDITERKQTEDALKESEERFKALHNASFGGIAIHDKGIILECNQGLSEITGYTYNELIGMDGLLLIAPN